MISGTFLSTLSGVNQPWTGQQFCHHRIRHRVDLGHPSMIKTKQSQQTCGLAEWRSRRIAPSYKFERYYFQTAHLNAKYQIVTGKLSFPKLLPLLARNSSPMSVLIRPKHPQKILTLFTFGRRSTDCDCDCASSSISFVSRNPVDSGLDPQKARLLLFFWQHETKKKERKITQKSAPRWHYFVTHAVSVVVFAPWRIPIQLSMLLSENVFFRFCHFPGCLFTTFRRRMRGLARGFWDAIEAQHC